MHSLPPYRRSPPCLFHHWLAPCFHQCHWASTPVFIPAAVKPPVLSKFPPATVLRSANSLPSADKNDSRFYPLHPVAVYSVLVFGTSQKCFFTTPFGSITFYCSLVASPCCLLGFPEVFLISIFGVQSHSKLCSSCVFGTTGAL